MKRVLSLITLVALLLMAMPSLQASVPDTATPFYAGTSHASTTLSISNFGVATCTATAALSSTLIKATVKMELQRLEGVDWVTVETWEKEFTEIPISLEKTKFLFQSGTYHVSTHFTIETTAGTDTLSTVSRSVER